MPAGFPVVQLCETMSHHLTQSTTQKPITVSMLPLEMLWWYCNMMLLVNVPLVHCLPICNIWCQFITIVLHTHTHTHTHTHARTRAHGTPSAGWHPYWLRNWITAVWSCLGRFTVNHAIFKAAVMLTLATCPENCAVLHKGLPVSLLTHAEQHHLHCYSSTTYRFQLHIW